MNKDRKEELLTRWMDDALSEEELRELEPVLAEHPELHEEREHLATPESTRVEGLLIHIICAAIILSAMILKNLFDCHEIM